MEHPTAKEPGERIWFLQDVPHLYKCIRNFIYSRRTLVKSKRKTTKKHKETAVVVTESQQCKQKETEVAVTESQDQQSSQHSKQKETNKAVKETQDQQSSQPSAQKFIDEKIQVVSYCVFF